VFPDVSKVCSASFFRANDPEDEENSVIRNIGKYCRSCDDGRVIPDVSKVCFASFFRANDPEDEDNSVI